MKKRILNKYLNTKIYFGAFSTKNIPRNKYKILGSHTAKAGDRLPFVA